MDKNHGGFVLLDEFCKWLEKGEIVSKTEMGIELMIGEHDNFPTTRSNNNSQLLSSRSIKDVKIIINNENINKMDSSLADKIAKKYVKISKDYDKDEVISKCKNWDLIDNNPSTYIN